MSPSRYAHPADHARPDSENPSLFENRNHCFEIRYFIFRYLEFLCSLEMFRLMKDLVKKILLLIVLVNLAHFSFSQTADSTRKVFHFGASALVTSNGISLIPTFSLGKPAAIFDIYMRKRRLSFEPEFRFSLEGKPWSFLFWWRYRLVEADRFKLNIGAHPALNFRTVPAIINGDSSEVTVARRYLAGEFVPNYLVTKNISIGSYYLYSHGLDEGTTKNTHFITLNSSFSNIRISKQFLFRVSPQVYYLKLDEQDGFYFSSSFGLARKNFPFAISSIINKTIHTNISASKSFVWNISLSYSFYKQYGEKQ